MLVLSRKLKEQIHIGDNITITVLRVKGKSVRIGIDAPEHIPVLRAELPRDQDSLRENGMVPSRLPPRIGQASADESEPVRHALGKNESSDPEMQPASEGVSEPVSTVDSAGPAALQLLLARRQRRRTSVSLPR